MKTACDTLMQRIDKTKFGCHDIVWKTKHVHHRILNEVISFFFQSDVFIYSTKKNSPFFLPKIILKGKKKGNMHLVIGF